MFLFALGFWVLFLFVNFGEESSTLTNLNQLLSKLQHLKYEKILQKLIEDCGKI